MLFRSLALCATFALTANSFLIPPSIGDDFSKDVANNIVDLNPQVLELDCNGCLYAEAREDGGYNWVPNVPYALVLNFSVPATDPETLNMNDVPIYPLNGGVRTSLSAPLHRLESSSVDPKAGDQETSSPSLGLSYSLWVLAPVEIAEDKDIKLVTIQLNILKVDRQFVNVDQVVLQLLKSADGHLSILRADKVADPNRPASPSDQEKAGEAKECTTFPLLCKWKAILEDKVNAVKSRPKGCHRHKSGPMQTVDSVHPGSHHPPHYINRHGPHGPQHGRMGHRHWHHTFLRTAQNIFFFILLPVMFGIAAGMLTSAIGMVVGKVLVWVWIRYHRGGKKGPYTKVQQDEPATEGEAEAGAGVMEKESAPPAYEEAEGQQEVVDEKQQQQQQPE
ncbi:MAG: hypothetical protein M1819_004506 [Sarea resinae]|nr:MAG: hypothetical protein M1819_004506 [Sarea resinae]